MLAVLVTLIYLSMQIRLTREEAEVQTTYSAVNLYANWRSHLINNPEVNELIVKANHGESLSEAETIRISAFVDDFVITSFVAHSTSRKGHPLYARSAEVEYLVRFLGANPGLESYWERIRDYVEPWDREFAEKIKTRRT